MFVTHDQIKQFEIQVMNNVLKQLGMCRECHSHRYDASQVIARFKLMRPNEVTNLIPNVDLLAKRLNGKYSGCVGCTDLRICSTICLLVILKNLRIYDCRKSKT